MSIVSSTYELGTQQEDGRKYVTETHTDHLSNTYTRQYLAEINEDYTSKMSFYALFLEEQLAIEEFNKTLYGN